jgi:hypothetical protein
MAVVGGIQRMYESMVGGIQVQKVATQQVRVSKKLYGYDIHCL